MTPAAARADVYRLLARLFLEEVDRPALIVLRGWPAFATVLGGGGEALLARLRAEYARLFLMNAYPYESVYVDPAVMLGGEASVAVERAYAEVGFRATDVPRAGGPDHVGVEMAFMAALASEESAADAAPGGGARAALARRRQRRFLARHLAAVMPPFALSAARDARHPFYRALAEVALAFVLADLAALPALDLEVADDLPHDSLADLDLAAVARHLATPVRAGVHLSREELHRLANRLALSVPLLERHRTIEVLFEEAARFGQLAALLGLLYESVDTAARRYAALAAENPGAAGVLAPWRRRAARTADGLAAMRRLAADAPG